MKVEKHHRRKEGKDDGDRRGKSFENIVRILDDDCRDETTKDLGCHSCPCPTAKVAEDVVNETVGSREPRCVQDGYKSWEKGKQ